jgi:hypothetical protein
MPLRNGKTYLKSHTCKCGKFYSNKEFDYQCSDCFNYLTKNGIMTSKEFSNKCDEWVTNNKIDEFGRKFLIQNKNITDQHLLNLLIAIFDNTGKYITADTALKLFKAHRTNRRGHIVGSFVADWWNIKSLGVSAEEKWPNYLDCYYGNYSEPMETWGGYRNEKTIPPHKPVGKDGRWLYCKIMHNLDISQY